MKNKKPYHDSKTLNCFSLEKEGANLLKVPIICDLNILCFDYRFWSMPYVCHINYRLLAQQ